MSRANDLVKAMVNIRDQDRVECGRHLFYLLGHNNSAFITESQLDELLFMTVRKRLDTSIYADMLLMAFGLLPGYEYENFTIGKRREKFLRESNWLKVNRKRKIKNYDSASKEELESALKSLRNVERHWMRQIADELTKQVNLKDKDGNEIKDALEKYIKLLKNNMEAVQDASGKIVDYVSKTPSPPDDEDFAPDDEVLDSGETSEQNRLEGISSSDEPKVPSPQSNDSDVAPHTDEVSTTAEHQEDSRSKEREQPHASTPPQSPKRDKTHKSWNIKQSVVFQFRDININIQPKHLLLSFFVLLLLVLVGVFAYGYFHRSGEDILTQNEPLAPGEIRQIVIVVPSEESAIGLLKYISSDPDLIDVSSSGFLMACQSRPGESSRSAEIQVLDETGVIATESYTVDFTKESFDPPVEDINDFVPDFTVSQKIRVASDTEWHNYVDAEVGDELEIQFEYRNTSENEHVNVAVRDILPANLGYIPGSTTLYTTQTSTGLKKEDGIAGDGIYIGTYGSNSNAWIRFRVRVVDINLANGVTGLVNWSQAGVNGVTLQDYATVRVSK